MFEITWLRADRPPEIQSHWYGEYPKIDLASAKMAILERYGCRPDAYFFLPPSYWFGNYYQETTHFYW